MADRGHMALSHWDCERSEEMYKKILKMDMNYRQLRPPFWDNGVKFLVTEDKLGRKSSFARTNKK